MNMYECRAGFVFLSDTFVFVLVDDEYRRTRRRYNIISFVVNLLHLKELYLEHCINIDDVVATSVLSCDAHLQALEALSLRMCEQFDSEELIAIALSHPSLRIYKIDGCCNLDVLSCVRIVNFPRLSLSEFVMTPDLDCHTIEEWNYLENMFDELRLC